MGFGPTDRLPGETTWQDNGESCCHSRFSSPRAYLFANAYHKLAAHFAVGPEPEGKLPRLPRSVLTGEVGGVRCRGRQSDGQFRRNLPPVSRKMNGHPYGKIGTPGPWTYVLVSLFFVTDCSDSVELISRERTDG